MNTKGAQNGLPEPDKSLIATFHLESLLQGIYSNGFINPIDPKDIASTVPADPESQLEREASLLMFYLDHVFHLQFPFLLPSASSGGRYWLLSLLTSTKPVYYATLSLAAMHFNPVVPAREGNSEEGRAILKQYQERFYIMSLQELQIAMDSWNSDGSKKDQRECIAILASILQLIYVDSTLSRVGTWSIHLDAAATLIPVLMQHLQDEENSSDEPPSLIPLSTMPRPEQRSPAPEVAKSRNFLLSAFKWLDTLSCMARRSQSLFQGHQYVFKTDNNCINQEQVSGCDERVLAMMMETVELEKWKRSLRVRDLARRAVDIEHRLEQHILDILHPSGGFVDHVKQLAHDDARALPNSPAAKMVIHASNQQQRQQLHQQQQQQIPALENGAAQPAPFRRQDWESSLARWCRTGSFCITYLHALATLTYLHVVVDGFKPELPEIRNSVVRAIVAFRNLPDIGLLHQLLLPLCVIGSLAQDPEHRRALWDLLTAAIDTSPDDTDTGQVSTIENRMLANDSKTALQALKDVWLMQDNCKERGEELDFGLAMNVLGGPICFL